jgi:hypothetical protein
VRRNAIYVAMMAYLASEEPATVPRARRMTGPRGRPAPACNRALRSYKESLAR